MQAMVRNYSTDAVFARLMKATRENAARIKGLPIGITNDEWFAAVARRNQLECMLHDLMILEVYVNEHPVDEGVIANHD